MKNFMNLHDFSSPIRSFFSTAMLNYDIEEGPAPLIPYYEGWCTDELAMVQRLSVYSNCKEALLDFHSSHGIYIEPSTQELFSFSLRLEDGSLIEILPLSNITHAEDKICHSVINILLKEKSNEYSWRNSNDSPKVTHIVTKGRLVYEFDQIDKSSDKYFDLSNIDYIEDLHYTLKAQSNKKIANI